MNGKQTKPSIKYMSEAFSPLNIAILTVSDTRTEKTDKSGYLLKELAEKDGHLIMEKCIIKDDFYHLRAMVSDWIHRQKIDVVLITGGTGFSSRDVTTEAIKPLLKRAIPGFGELFRHISYRQIGSSTIQSRAFAGIANHTLVVAMPGSTNACRTAWEHILSEQLDASHKPCNFVSQLKEQSND